MNLLIDKVKEVTRTLLPVLGLVLLLCFTIVDVRVDVIIRFIVGSVMLLIGLSTFLWGVDLAMNPIGEHMSIEVATSRTPVKIAILSLLLGFLITVAEPDLLILGSQVQVASGGTLRASIIVYLVSTGVGVMITLGVFRLMRNRPLNVFMAVVYGTIFVLAIFVSEEFLAISFDASGATTGALTTPFVLALSLGLSRIKGGRNTEENAFGLVGVMSAGPILAVMLMSIISGQKHIQGDAGEFVAKEGVIRPIIEVIPTILLESLIALLPITILFFAFNFKRFKIPKDELLAIIKGLVFVLLGLCIFLTAVNSGFMDMGRIIGMELARLNQWVLIGVGFLLGFIIVLVEPAVHVLGEQIEGVTVGHIPVKLIRMTLSIGVALAVAFSMIRIVVPEVKLWFFIVPGFAIAMLLSFKSDPVFVGIAYDAGGVASGPMTATFVLAFAQGAASVIDTADVMVDGFGIIAMVAMAPVLSLMILGTAFRHKKIAYPVTGEKQDQVPPVEKADELQHSCVMVVVNRGFAEKVVEIGRQSGAEGATILHGRGMEADQRVMLPIINIELQPEKDVVLFVSGSHISECIADNLLSNQQLDQDGDVSVFISPTEVMMETFSA